MKGKIITSLVAVFLTPVSSYSAIAPWLQEIVEKEAIQRIEEKSDLISNAKILQLTQYIDGSKTYTQLVVELPMPNDNRIITILPSYNPMDYYCSGRGRSNPLMKNYGLSKTYCSWGREFAPPGGTRSAFPISGNTYKLRLKKIDDNIYAPTERKFWFTRSGLEHEVNAKTEPEFIFELKVTGRVNNVKLHCISDGICSTVIDGIEVVSSEGFWDMSNPSRKIKPEHIEHALEIGDYASAHCGIKEIAPIDIRGDLEKASTTKCYLYGKSYFYLKKQKMPGK